MKYLLITGMLKAVKKILIAPCSYFKRLLSRDNLAGIFHIIWDLNIAELLPPLKNWSTSTPPTSINRCFLIITNFQ